MISIDIFQPIIPAESAAGIKLGTHINDLSEYIDLTKGDSSFRGSTKYELLNGVIIVRVHNNSGRIYGISVYSGYKGLLFGSLNPGMPINSLLTSSEWYFDDGEGALLHKENIGVAIAIDLEEPLSVDELRGKDIFEIAVSVKNIHYLDRDW